jgi:hypothetical protein
MIKRGNLDKFFLTLTASYFLGVICWVVSQKFFFNQTSAQAQSHTEFIAYMQKALTVIDHKKQLVENNQGATSSPSEDLSLLKPEQQLPLTPLPSLLSSSFDSPTQNNPELSQAKLVDSEITFTLVGLLENGDRSVALVSFNGVTEKIQLGEEIGVSGWTLVSVDDQLALITREGKQKILTVGDKL